MADFTDKGLDALALYEACRDGNIVNGAHLMGDVNTFELLTGMVNLVGSLMHTTAAALGCPEDELIERLRAMYLAGAET